MSTLLIRLAAPLQAWGVDSKYENRRNTERIPSKSGVVGLIAAALGRKRDESISDISDLKYGVRVDQEGVLVRDFQTARPESEKNPYVTNRYYLSDAVFLVGLEGDTDTLKMLGEALLNPVYPLFLGRRSCPPTGKLLLGIREDMNLIDALKNEPWQISEWMKKRNKNIKELDIFIDSSENYKSIFLKRDIPVSFDYRKRSFSFRGIYETKVEIKDILKSETNNDIVGALNIKSDEYSIIDSSEHDPMFEISNGFV